VIQILSQYSPLTPKGHVRTCYSITDGIIPFASLREDTFGLGLDAQLIFMFQTATNKMRIASYIAGTLADIATFSLFVCLLVLDGVIVGRSAYLYQ
jgi:hypothetical protein